MAISAAVGQAHALNGREASAQAIHKALNEVEREPIAMGLIFASYDYDIQEIMGGAAALLGDIPLLGFSTSGEFTSKGQSRRSVVVALLTGAEAQVKANWWEGFSEDSQAVTERMVESFLPQDDEYTLLLVADGLSGDGALLCQGLPEGDYTVAGCLAGGDLRLGRTFQIGGAQAGTGGLAAALLTGQIRAGVGAAHGWQEVGAYFQITRARDSWVGALDGRPASETYARLFGYQAREWAFPPLNTLVRLYPLGLELDGRETLQVRTPISVEADGSLRMNTTVPDGAVGHLLVGSAENCMEAAREATRKALSELGDARPVLALVLADVSWQMLLEAQPGIEINAVREALGPDIPIAGGYTFGQIARPDSSGQPELLNQHIEVIVIGEKG